MVYIVIFVLGWAEFYGLFASGAFAGKSGSLSGANFKGLAKKSLS